MVGRCTTRRPIHRPTGSPANHSPDVLEPSRVLDLALGAGEILLSGGASASEVTVTCTEVAEAGGLHRVECDVTFTSLTLAGRPGPGEGTAISAMRLVHQLAAGAILGEFLAQAARRTGSHRDTRLLRRLTGLRPAEPPQWRRLGPATGPAGAPDPDDAVVPRRLPGHE